MCVLSVCVFSLDFYYFFPLFSALVANKRCLFMIGYYTVSMRTAADDDDVCSDVRN